jgi:hypothetical protein
MNEIRQMLAGSLCAVGLLAATGVQAQTAGQQPPVGTDMPSTQHQQEVLQPAPEMQERAGEAGQAQGNDAASPAADAAAAAAPGGPCETAMPATTHQQDTLRTAQGCQDDQGSVGTTTGPQGTVQPQQGGQTTQP